MKKLILTLLIIWNSSLFAASTDLAGVCVSIAQGVNEANAMFEKGEYDSAWTLLLRLVREDPTNADVNLLMLKVANKSGRFNQSIAIMERLVATNPNNAKLHLELSKAYAIAGDKENSNAQMTIAKELDPSLESANLEYELSKRATNVQNRSDRFQIAGNISFGFIYNSNANTGIDGLDIVIGVLQLKLNDVVGKKLGWGEYLATNINVGYKVSQDSQWWAVGNINAYGVGYNNKVPANQYFGWGRVGAELRYLGTTDLFEVCLKVEDGIYRPEENMFAGGIESTWVHAFTPNWQSI